MLKYIKFIFIGTLFGVIMSKSEAVSWYRIQEMFLFDSFHMYGIIGTAVLVGVIMVALIKKFKIKDLSGQPIEFHPKKLSIARYLIGGTIFGIGWAMTGACPGPMYTLLGHGYWAMLIVIGAAFVGTWTYGVLKDKLPH